LRMKLLENVFLLMQLLQILLAKSREAIDTAAEVC
jgi:hypothetical protein